MNVGRTKTLLIVDDEEWLGVLFRSIFNKKIAGVKFTFMSSMLRVRQDTKKYDVALVDWHIGQFLGSDMLRYIDAKKMVFFSGDPHNENLKDCAEQNKMEIIEKPITIKKIKELLNG